ncbi:hypothetical protein J4417_01030 [Candidatus Woesearchaeota archaeon]|nr:hypothetical protein [Candidatus Woesearchaeota archaeon]
MAGGQGGKKSIAVAGTTETGNIDDLEGIANLLDEFENEFEYRPHFHVDAAHGGGFVFHDLYSPKKNGLLKGINRADSITVDPHKMLYTHYNAGCILFKNKQDHYLLKQTADYLFKNDGSCNLGQFRVEGSMGLEGAIQTWASLFCLGKKGYQTILQHVLDLTEYLEGKIKATTCFEVLHKREMNILCFRYYNPEFSEEVNNEINKEAQKRMYDTGKAYISNENQLHTIAGEKKKIEVFRAIPMHPWTKREDIDFAFEEVNNAICSTLSDREKYFQRSIASIKNGGA